MCIFKKGALFIKTVLTGLFSKEKFEVAGIPHRLAAPGVMEGECRLMLQTT